MSQSHMPQAAPRHLVLVGYRGSGKSSIGKELAMMLGLDFLDTDHAIQEKAGKSVREIFAEQGEPVFRDMETEILEDLVDHARNLPPSVIATGGGMIMRLENRRLLKKLGPVVWLKVEPKVALHRIIADTFTHDQRPSLTEHDLADEVRTMVAERMPYYAATADLTIDNDRPGETREDVAARIIDQLRQSHWYNELVARLNK